MKKQLLLIICTLALALSSMAQAPQGFSYQAVVRNAQGEPLEEQAVSVMITIQHEDGTATHYAETHSVTTSAQGVITLNIGSGTPTTGTFADIPWVDGRVFLKLEVDPDGGTSYSHMGTTQLLAVPYALYAQSASEVVVPPNASEEEPLFVVKNNAGQIVFAVYQTGVRIYVDDTPSTAPTKQTRGGFAVGGLSDQTKVDPVEYMRVTPDSARIYLRSNTSKQTRGGFAVGGLSDQTKESSSFLYLTPENYFIGHNSGNAITSGLYNSALGYESGMNITEGESNSFVGYQSGYNNTLGTGNLFLGYQTGYSNVDGNYNSFLGYLAGNSNTTGTYNTFLGSFSGFSNTEGRNNTFVGDSTGFNNTHGIENTFMGTGCGKNNNSGSSNVFIGNKSGFSNTEGFTNVFIGNRAGYLAVNGVHNVFIGDSSGYSSTSTWGNVNIGFLSGFNTTVGGANTFIGAKTGYSNITGFSNTFLGIEAGYSLESDCCNTFLGDHAGYYVKSGYKNLLIGAYSGYNESQVDTASYSNVLIGNGVGYKGVGGFSNVFIGFESGYNNSFSFNDVFMGYQAGYNNTTGSYNVFIGNEAGRTNEEASCNVFIGHVSGYSNLDGGYNVFVGNQSGHHNVSGGVNVFLGHHSGWKNISGSGNILIGSHSGYSNETGNSNVIVGDGAGFNNVDGSGNTILGAFAADEDLLGIDNVIIGATAGRKSNGDRNIIIGHGAGYNNKGNANILIGDWAGANELGSNKLYIENSDRDSLSALIWGDFENDLLRFNGGIGINGHPVSWTDLSINKTGNGGVFAINGTGNDWYYSQIKLMSQEEKINRYWELNHRIGNAFNIIFHDGVDSWKEFFSINTEGSVTIGDQATAPILLDVNGNAKFREVGSGAYSAALSITEDGTLTTQTSDISLKTNISTLTNALSTIAALRGVHFSWINDENSTKKVGFIAQEVEKVLPEVVFTNPTDGLKGVNYAEITAVLVEAVKEQQQQIIRLEDKLKNYESLKAEIEAIKTLISK